MQENARVKAKSEGESERKNWEKEIKAGIEA